MRISLIVMILAAISVAGEASAAGKAQEVRAAKKKARILEKKAAGESKKAVPPSVKITKPEAQADDRAGVAALNDPIICLSRAIYWEARGEKAASREAIANVVMNRLGNKKFPDTVCKIVKQHRKEGGCEFTWWCDRRSLAAKEDKSYASAKEIARKALNRQLHDRTGGALYFRLQSAPPVSSKEYEETAHIGKFIFFKPRGKRQK